MQSPDFPRPEQSIAEKFTSEYRKVLAKYLPEDLKNATQPKQVKEVGVGFGHPLQAFLESIGKVDYEGIDLNTKGAEAVNMGLPVKFTTADARKRAVLGDNNDLVIFRNPKVLGDVLAGDLGNVVVSDWQQMISNAIDSLKNGGYLFFTTPSETEIEKIDQFLKAEGGLVGLGPELIQPSIKVDFPMVEKYIAIYQQKAKNPGSSRGSS